MINLSYILPDMKTNTNPLDNVIIWNKKKYVMPFDADYGRQKADTFKEEIIVKNRFSGETGVACHVQYNPQTGRLLECSPEFEEVEDEF